MQSTVFKQFLWKASARWAVGGSEMESFVLKSHPRTQRPVWLGEIKVIHVAAKSPNSLLLMGLR